MLPDKKEAFDILTYHVKDEYQILHSKMVAIVMEEYAKKYNVDQDMWYITGLLHDLDYYKYPESHPTNSLKWFKEWNYPDELIHAVKAHAFKYNGFEEEPETKMASHLIAIDELCGLIHAYTLMNPQGIDGTKAKSIKKKMKDKNFAAKINREDIKYGIEKSGLELSEHIQFVIDVLKSRKSDYSDL